MPPQPCAPRTTQPPVRTACLHRGFFHQEVPLMRNILPAVILLLCIALGIGSRFRLAPNPKAETSSTPPTGVATTEPLSQQPDTPRSNRLLQSQDKAPLEDDFYRVIIENNLFRPLGWTPPSKNTTPYRLLGTLLSRDTLARTILQDSTSQQIYIVTLGETLGAFHVAEIHPRQVTLENGERTITLRLDKPLFLNPRRGPTNRRKW